MTTIDNVWIQWALHIALWSLLVLLVPSVYRLINGPSIGDRLLGNDMITTLLLGIIVLLAALEHEGLLVDVALALAALSFVGTLALARYVGEGKVF